MSYTALGADAIAARLYRHDQIHTALNSPDDFGDEHLRQYRELGFVAINNIFPPEMVADAKAALRELILYGAKRQDLDLMVQIEPAADGKPIPQDQRELYVRKLMYFTQHDERLRRMCEYEPMLRIVRLLAESDVRMFQDMALLKPPMIGAEKPWHQDVAYFRMAPIDRIVGTWTALDPATVENGCMHVIPGTHLRGPAPHVHDRDCQLRDEDVDVQNDIAVPLAPGGTLFFSGLLHHGTPPNRSAARRQAQQFHYASVECRLIDPDEHQRFFSVNGRYAGCTGGGLTAQALDEMVAGGR
jgi:phytanoyl-CoA hydroxylase